MDIPNSTSLAKILIIDADAEARRNVATYLSEAGYELFEAIDGKSGLEQIKQCKPACVLCDLNLPKIEDKRVIKQISEEHNEIPIIVISEEGLMSDVVESLRMGASDFLIKPIVDLEVLEHAIERSLERYNLRQENLRYRAQLEQANSDLKNNLAVLEQDQQAGLLVQMKMLPVSPMQKSAYVFSHHIVPSLYLSGDFVEYITVGSDNIVFFVADVSGHGASSAFVTVLLKNLAARMRSDYSRQHLDTVLHPTEFLAQANAELLDTGIGKHATLFYAVLNTRRNTLVYSVAGQLPLPILIESGQARYLEGMGAPVGLFEDTEYQETIVELPSEFRLLLFSDGVLEVLNQSSLTEKEQYLLERAPSLKGVPESVLSSLDIDSEKKYPDDIAVLIVDKH